MVLQLLQLLFHLIQGGFYPAKDLVEVLPTLIQLLDGRDDKVHEIRRRGRAVSARDDPAAPPQPRAHLRSLYSLPQEVSPPAQRFHPRQNPPHKHAPPHTGGPPRRREAFGAIPRQENAAHRHVGHDGVQAVALQDPLTPVHRPPRHSALETAGAVRFRTRLGRAAGRTRPTPLPHPAPPSIQVPRRMGPWRLGGEGGGEGGVRRRVAKVWRGAGPRPAGSVHVSARRRQPRPSIRAPPRRTRRRTRHGDLPHGAAGARAVSDGVQRFDDLEQGGLAGRLTGRAPHAAARLGAAAHAPLSHAFVLRVGRRERAAAREGAREVVCVDVRRAEARARHVWQRRGRFRAGADGPYLLRPQGARVVGARAAGAPLRAADRVEERRAAGDGPPLPPPPPHHHLDTTTSTPQLSPSALLPSSGCRCSSASRRR